MAQRTKRPFAAALALAAVLALAGPARAEAAAPRGPASVWQWLQGVWAEGISRLWPGPGNLPDRAPARLPAKTAGDIDPDGGAGSQTTGGGPACQVRNEAGTCLDPDG